MRPRYGSSSRKSSLCPVCQGPHNRPQSSDLRDLANIDDVETINKTCSHGFGESVQPTFSNHTSNALSTRPAFHPAKIALTTASHSSGCNDLTTFGMSVARTARRHSTTIGEPGSASLSADVGSPLNTVQQTDTRPLPPETRPISLVIRLVNPLQPRNVSPTSTKPSGFHRRLPEPKSTSLPRCRSISRPRR